MPKSRRLLCSAAFAAAGVAMAWLVLPGPQSLREFGAAMAPAALQVFVGTAPADASTTAGRGTWIALAALAAGLLGLAGLRMRAAADPLLPVGPCAGNAPGLTAARSSEALAIADRLPVLIAYVDEQLHYRFCNRLYLEAIGAQSFESVAGRRIDELPGYRDGGNGPARALRGERVAYERHETQGGWTRFWRIEYIPDSDDDGKIAGFHILGTDVTELKLVEAELRLLARTDALTGLPNRIQFNDRLSEAISRSSRTGLQLAVMYLDIDRFKSINDSLGHQVGDDVLREFARRLRTCVRATDMVARLAGDEFVILLDGLHDSAEPIAVARKILQAMEEEFPVTVVPQRISASIGIAVGDHQADAQALICRADQALYRAKSAGRSRFEIA